MVARSFSWRLICCALLISLSKINFTWPLQSRQRSRWRLAHIHQAASTGSPLYVTAKHASVSEQQLFRKLSFSGVMVVPLITGSGHAKSSTPRTYSPPHTSQCIGFAFVNFQNPGHHPGKGQFAFAQDIAAQCALAVEKDRLLSDVHAVFYPNLKRANTLDAVFQDDRRYHCTQPGRGGTCSQQRCLSIFRDTNKLNR